MTQMKEIVINLILFALQVLFYRAEMFKGSYADNAIKQAKSINSDIFPVLYIGFQAAAFTSLYLFRR